MVFLLLFCLFLLFSVIVRMWGGGGECDVIPGPDLSCGGSGRGCYRLLSEDGVLENPDRALLMILVDILKHKSIKYRINIDVTFSFLINIF